MKVTATVTPAEILESFKKLNAAQANEAETRLKLIDQIIFGILGWSHDDVSVEARVSEDGKTTFCDYKCNTAMTSFVVEAKKVGSVFDTLPNVRRTRLRGSIMTGITGESIKQARDYARTLSVGFAVVTNGSQWMVFPVNRRDGVQFSDSAAIIFPYIESVLNEDFGEFYELLSRQAVISGSLENELLGRVENQIEERRLNRFFPRAFTRRSPVSLYSLVEEAIVTAFTEGVIDTDSDLLKNHRGPQFRLWAEKRLALPWTVEGSGRRLFGGV